MSDNATRADTTPDPERPWYADGLRFTCTQCGDCCSGAPGYVWVTDDELAAIAKYLGQPLAEVRELYSRKARGRRTLRERDNGDCVFLSAERGCTIYPVRPPQCRTWPFWDSTVESPEEWQKTCDVCPGAGTGELIPVEEISRRVRAIRM
ncbi:MAG: YkgJ family cysteine cluster protein [Planctomycetes bacterium]|nr:YkgJ family cysteine cluster protein [Planctomycetota bacterium]